VEGKMTADEFSRSLLSSPDTKTVNDFVGMLEKKGENRDEYENELLESVTAGLVERNRREQQIEEIVIKSMKGVEKMAGNIEYIKGPRLTSEEFAAEVLKDKDSRTVKSFIDMVEKMNPKDVDKDLGKVLEIVKKGYIEKFGHMDAATKNSRARDNALKSDLFDLSPDDVKERLKSPEVVNPPENGIKGAAARLKYGIRGFAVKVMNSISKASDYVRGMLGMAKAGKQEGKSPIKPMEQRLG